MDDARTEGDGERPPSPGRSSGPRRAFLSAAVVVVCLLVAAGAFALTRRAHIGILAVPHGTPTATTSGPSTPSAVLGAGSAPATGSAMSPPQATAAAVSAALAPALNAAALGPVVSAQVLDADTGATLYARDAGTATRPASTNKIVTAAALLAVRDPADRITTTVVAGTSPGQVVLVGGGDPTLSAAAAGQPTLYRGAARMSDLAAQVRAHAGGTITSVVVDDSLFSGPLTAPGWAAEDVPSDYQSGVTPAMVDGGLPAGGGTIRVARPDLEAGRALANLLGVPDAPVSTGTAPAGARTLGSVRSAPLLDLVEQMLKLSDNVIADLLSRQVALQQKLPASFSGAEQAVRRVLVPLGVRLPDTLVDGSGLSVDDRLAPSALTGLMRTVLRTPRLAPIVTALPVSGWDGTLGPRYAATGSRAGAGSVRAKTGSYTGVVTLAGVLTVGNGRRLVFAVMTDRVPTGGTAAAEAAVDVAVTRLVSCSCR